jgi:hypothetical protein
VNELPLIPAPLYGLRTWRLAADADGEALTASCMTTRWPDGGAWLHATCGGSGDHQAPHADCLCGIHAWHPRRWSARRILASRFEVPGVVEATGAIELQDDGFRAERARPYALVVTPGGNAARAARLARRYGARLVEVTNADGLLAWCAERGLGLSEPTVDDLLGPDYVGRRRADRRRQRRRALARVGTIAAIGAAGVGIGAAFATGPSNHGIYGRTGWVKHPPGACPKPAQHAPNPRDPRPVSRDC